MYSKDNGNSWEESTSNTHTFNNLTDSTQYNIKVKVVDSEGLESTEYYEAITTEIYILPVVASVNATTTWNSITLTPTGTDGTNTIDHYEYSIDDGAYQESNVFSNLTDNTEYTIKVKAIDSIGRESNIYEIQVKTDEYKLPVISNVTADSTKDSITINVNATPGDGNIVSYHYSKDDGSNYETSTNNSYTFSGLTSGTIYYLKIYVTDNNGRTSAVYASNIATKSNTFADYIINNVYTGVDGENGLYYHDGAGTYGSQEAEDNSYRYTGANPNNYVCFGSDEASCPADNLYRIIGVFGNQVKLIKHDYAGQSVLGTAQHGSTTPNATYYKGSLSSIPYYHWSGSSSNSSNTWSSSTLNTSILNGTYLNTLGSKWSNLIATTSWKVGGNTTSNIYNVPVKSAYENEIVSPAESTTYSAKVGLMYVSDYGYAASPENWNTDLYGYDNDTNRDNNWMYMGAYEWLISRRSDNTYDAFYVFNTGYVNNSGVSSINYGVRPSFYLESSVVLESGTGTQENPYRIAI